MKKLLKLLLIIITLFALVTPVMAIKPNGAEFIEWNLSADVMPVPPYGSLDIPGSDTSSKLIVNQPNGKTTVTITGAMNGLNPSQTYLVYLSKGYTQFISWPGFFTANVPVFTFTANEFGEGSWHLNLTEEDFPGTGTYWLSVWINLNGRTILISDNFSVSVD